MILGPSILCPIDFSEASRSALRYAGVIAAHFGARLTLVAVRNPLLGEALDLGGGDFHLPQDTVGDVEEFVRHTFSAGFESVPDVRIEAPTGKPAPEILRVSRQTASDLIVMSSHGASGFRKLFFGSTTERVLRETTVPVLITPGEGAGPEDLHAAIRQVRRVLLPVDFSDATAHQTRVARGLAEALDVPILLLNVVEPVRSSTGLRARLPSIEAELRYRAERQLDELVRSMPPRVGTEGLVAYGEPAEEIAKIATARDAGLLVMGLHSSPLLGPRMGSVTYRVLCLAHRLVLAVPPHQVSSAQVHVQHRPEMSAVVSLVPEPA